MTSRTTTHDAARTYRRYPPYVVMLVVTVPLILVLSAQGHRRISGLIINSHDIHISVLAFYLPPLLISICLSCHVTMCSVEIAVHLVTSRSFVFAADIGYIFLIINESILEDMQ